jgi:glycosyltransferase involved in cell wall biosynthesis
MKRLAIITTHPIQYNAPLFKVLSERKVIDIKVFYTMGDVAGEVYDQRFGITRKWDIPLLSGYEYEFVKNTSSKPDSNRFWGVINHGLQQKINAYHPDAVLVLRWSVFSHLKLMQLKNKGVRLFFRGDSHLLVQTTGVKAYLKKWALRFVFRKTDTAFFVGAANKEYYRAAGLTEQQLLFAPHAVDNKHFANDAAANETIALQKRRELGIPDDALVFLYAGKFYKIKNLVLLINAFLKVDNTKIYLLMIGSGEQENLLKQLAAGNQRILFDGFKNQSQMPWVYRMGDVFVLPSISETWGLSVNEAMACGRTVLISKTCGCMPELIKEGETGFAFDTLSETSLIESIKKFSSANQVKQMGVQAAEHIQKFSLEAVAGVIEKACTTGDA